MCAGTYYKTTHMSVIDNFNAHQFTGILEIKYYRIQTLFAAIQKTLPSVMNGTRVNFGSVHINVFHVLPW
jgi:hypothetical protein